MSVPPTPRSVKHFSLSHHPAHPICLNVLTFAEPLPSALLLATTSRTRLRQLHPHCSLLLPLATVFEPQKAFHRPRRLSIFFSGFHYPNDSCSNSNHLWDPSPGCQQHDRIQPTQAIHQDQGRIRQVYYYFLLSAVCFLRFANRIMSSESNVTRSFSFAQHQRPRLPQEISGTTYQFPRKSHRFYSLRHSLSRHIVM